MQPANIGCDPKEATIIEKELTFCDGDCLLHAATLALEGI